MTLKIYSDRQYLPDGMNHVAILVPFWGNYDEPDGHPNSGRFSDLGNEGASFMMMTSLKESDVAIAPSAWEHVIKDQVALKQTHELIDRARALGKKTLIFFFSDSEEKVDLENSIIFRTSLNRSEKATREFAMPAWNVDFIKRYCGGEIIIRKKRLQPVVGFCGLSGVQGQPKTMRLKRTSKWLLGRAGIMANQSSSRPGLGHVLRQGALELLDKDPGIQTNFIIRERFFSSGLESNIRVLNNDRNEYARNMINSDYILCIRGEGNFSYRVYETLSCGRIPVFVDTDSVLPYDFIVNWKEYCVWIDIKDIDQISQILSEFHESLTPKQFEDIQIKCREMWVKWLSPTGFHQEIERHWV